LLAKWHPFNNQKNHPTIKILCFAGVSINGEALEGSIISVKIRKKFVILPTQAYWDQEKLFEGKKKRRWKSS
jgi:hypothetical protein